MVEGRAEGERKQEIKQDKELPCTDFISQMPAVVMVSPGQGWKPRIRSKSFTWVAGTQVLELPGFAIATN